MSSQTEPPFELPQAYSLTSSFTSALNGLNWPPRNLSDAVDNRVRIPSSSTCLEFTGFSARRIIKDQLAVNVELDASGSDRTKGQLIIRLVQSELFYELFFLGADKDACAIAMVEEGIIDWLVRTYRMFEHVDWKDADGLIASLKKHVITVGGHSPETYRVRMVRLGEEILAALSDARAREQCALRMVDSGFIFLEEDTALLERESLFLRPSLS